MSSLAQINHLIQRAHHDGLARPLLSILKGVRNGVVYGTKIRFPHALVMTFLFRSGSLQSKIEAILEATSLHAKNLAKFVFIYKTLTTGASALLGPSGYQSFVAAFVGGYYVFGENNNINSQINMYLLSRILFGLAKLGTEKGVIPKVPFDPFPWFAALVWGIVLWLFEYHKHVLQGSLQASMTYLYHDSNVWNNLRTLLWHNK